MEPFASSAGLRATIDKVNELQERLTVMTLFNLELTKMLIKSGHVDRARALKILDSIAEVRSVPDHEEGKKFATIIKGLLESQTEGN